MSRQREFKLVGTLGNVIFYNRLGQYCMRIKPTDVRRTEASVHSGLNFGRASRIGKQIRNLVRLVYSPQSDSLVINRLNGAINKFLSWREKMFAAANKMPPKLPFIYRFQFNSQSDLSTISAIQPVVTTTNPETTEINFAPSIPVQSLHAPANTVSILIKMILISTNLNDTQTKLLVKSEIEIPFIRETFQIQPIVSDAPKQSGDLVILIMSVQYMVNKKGGVEVVKDKKKQPCGIVWASVF